jgi:hypothetical protein
MSVRSWPLVSLELRRQLSNAGEQVSQSYRVESPVPLGGTTTRTGSHASGRYDMTLLRHPGPSRRLVVGDVIVGKLPVRIEEPLQLVEDIAFRGVGLATIHPIPQI